MKLESFAYLSDYSSKIDSLSELARPERWDYKIDSQDMPKKILVNYISHTFRRLCDLDRSYPDNNFLYADIEMACFNTGLFTRNFEPIFALFCLNDPGFRNRWKLMGFFKESSHELREISHLPRRAEYFDEVRDLIYDTRLELRLNIDHILDDEANRKRIPEQYRNHPSLPMLFRGVALEYAKVRVRENYKSAVPQYFKGKIQFLLPISLGDPSVVDMSLAVGRVGDIYTGRTCLTLDMAYNNARLIAKPESDWLIGGSIAL